jgi:hypothetical protein
MHACIIYLNGGRLSEEFSGTKNTTLGRNQHFFCFKKRSSFHSFFCAICKLVTHFQKRSQSWFDFYVNRSIIFALIFFDNWSQ